MGFRIRALYLVWAVIRSCVEIIAAIVLFAAAYMWTLSLSESALRGQGPTILLGVVSSVIATLLISISSKYSASCRAHTNIVHCATEMSRWVRTHKDYFCVDRKGWARKCRSYFCTDHEERTKQSFYLNQYYMNMCSEACQLTYREDFSNFSKSIAFFTRNLNESLTVDEFEQTVEDFELNVNMYNQGHVKQNED